MQPLANKAGAGSADVCCWTLAIHGMTANNGEHGASELGQHIGWRQALLAWCLQAPQHMGDSYLAEFPRQCVEYEPQQQTYTDWQ